MNFSNNQRQVIAYHGCDASVRDAVLSGSNLAESKNDYDWLGHGIYFWEYGLDRAFAWAKEQAKRGRIDKPAVLGAVLHTGQCFDLLDVRYTDVLTLSYKRFTEILERERKVLPANSPSNANDPDRLLRRLDCAILNWTIEEIEEEIGTKFASVRGVFQEGERAFPDSAIFRKSHIQIAVRDPSCIVGYFLPSLRKDA